MESSLPALRNYSATTSQDPAPDPTSNDPSSSAKRPKRTSTAASSSNPPYHVFISHAGEDKSMIALPLREKLKARGITAFVDEADMPLGTDAKKAMTEAMETARVAVIVLSPEFVARKWPMRELMCFLRRRQECSGDNRVAPVVIPFFYRLNIAELYDEPRLDRTNGSGKLLYRESRFYQRQRLGEPEASIAHIKAALETVHGIMGLRNDVDASNDSSYVMERRREFLLQELCDKVRDALCTRVETNTKTETAGEAGNNAFQAYFDAPHDNSELVFDFDTRDRNGNASTQEGQVLQMLLDKERSTNRAIGVRGIAGVGKTTLLQGIRSLERVRHRFRDGVYSLSLGVDATRAKVIAALCIAVEKSGGREMAEAIRKETDVRKVIDQFRVWFSKKQCLFVIDDVWETSEMSSGTIDELFTLHVSGRDSKVLMTTRSAEIASRGDRYFCLEPRGFVGNESQLILFRYARIEPEQDREDDQRAVNKILTRCGGLPLFLAIAGRSVRALSFRRGHGGCMAYHTYAQSLEIRMGMLLTTDIGSYEGLRARLMISIELLERRKKDFGFKVTLAVAQILRRLSVMTKQTQVPMRMLKHLWELESERHAADLARELEQVGLADVEFERRECGPVEVLHLHDSIYDFAVTESRKHGEEKSGHEALSRGYGHGLAKRNGCREWWDTSVEADGYIHGNVCRHLVGMGGASELVYLLLSPQWAERQVKINGVLFLEADFSLGITAVKDGWTDETDADRSEIEKSLWLISDAVALSSGFVAGNTSELLFQLHGRLKGFVDSYESIGDYISWVEMHGKRPLVRCKTSFLGEPGGACTRIIALHEMIVSMAMMNDGKRIACGLDSGEIAVVNVEQSLVEKKWKAHRDSVNSVASDMMGKRLVSGSLVGTAKVWDIETGRCVAVFRGHTDRKWINDIAVMGDGRRIISVSADGAKVWDGETGQMVSKAFTGHSGSGSIGCVAVLGGGEEVLTGGSDRKLRLWNVATGAQAGDTFDHSQYLGTVVVTPDGQSLVSSDRETLKVWDTRSHQQIGSSLKGHTGRVTCISLSRDGRRIVSGGDDKTIRVWDIESRKAICAPLEGHTGYVRGVSFLSDAEHIVSCSHDGTVRVWDVRREKATRAPDRHGFCVTSVCFTPDGRFVLSTSGDEYTVAIWDSFSGTIADVLQGPSAYSSDVVVAPLWAVRRISLPG